MCAQTCSRVRAPAAKRLKYSEVRKGFRARSSPVSASNHSSVVMVRGSIPIEGARWLASWTAPAYDPAMDTRIRVGTSEGLWEIDGDRVAAAPAFAGMPLTAVAEDGGRSWAIVAGRTLWRESERGWAEHAAVKGLAATCLAPTSAGLLVGTEQAHLLKLGGDALEPVAAFDATEGRDTWYTPWGDPADVRSIAS